MVLAGPGATDARADKGGGGCGITYKCDRWLAATDTLVGDYAEIWGSWNYNSNMYVVDFAYQSPYQGVYLTDPHQGYSNGTQLFATGPHNNNYSDSSYHEHAFRDSYDSPGWENYDTVIMMVDAHSTGCTTCQHSITATTLFPVYTQSSPDHDVDMQAPTLIGEVGSYTSFNVNNVYYVYNLYKASAEQRGYATHLSFIVWNGAGSPAYPDDCRHYIELDDPIDDGHGNQGYKRIETVSDLTVYKSMENGWKVSVGIISDNDELLANSEIFFVYDP